MHRVPPVQAVQADEFLAVSTFPSPLPFSLLLSPSLCPVTEPGKQPQGADMGVCALQSTSLYKPAV